MGARKMGTVMMAAAVLVATLAVPALAEGSGRGIEATLRPAADQVVDRPAATDELPLVRGRCQVDPRPERCPDRPDRPDQVNVRQLIWRLIKAGEWRMLFHLLDRIGII